MNCIIYSLFFALSCITSFNITRAEQKTSSPQKQEVWITILVHGIMSVKPHLSISNFCRFFTDTVDNSIYSNTVLFMREDEHFNQNQPMQQEGLVKIDPNNINAGCASTASAHVLNTMFNFVYGPKQKHHLYTFGWTGLLSPKHRRIDGEKFYLALYSLISDFQKRNIQPKIRIIGYSHGGNVCLNLAFAHKKYVQKMHNFSVDELILLGMPVQKETDHLINDLLFKKIYHIYSRKDRIQKLDCFSFNRFFSQRIFKRRKGFSLPDKLTQIQLKCTRNAKTTSKRKHRIDATYNFQSAATVSGKSRYLRDASPGHTELWFFGWTPVHYRQNYPLYPLPALAFVPAIIQAAQTIEYNLTPHKPTVVDIRPEHEVVLVKNQQSKRVLTINQFLPTKELIKLKQLALSCAPESFPVKVYNDHIQLAYDRAVEQHLSHHPKHRKKHRKRKKLSLLQK